MWIITDILLNNCIKKIYKQYKNNLDAASDAKQSNDLISQIFIFSKICE